MVNTTDINPAEAVDDSAISALAPTNEENDDILNSHINKVLRSIGLGDLTADSDLVQIRKEPDGVYLDIGRSKRVEKIYTDLNDRIVAADNKFLSQMRAILTQLQAEEIQDTGMTPIVATPVRKNRTKKRPAPKSTTASKVVIHKARRSNDQHEPATRKGQATKANTTDQSMSPRAMVEAGLARFDRYAEMMSELTINDPDSQPKAATKSKPPNDGTKITTTSKKNATKSAQPKQQCFIANEPSVIVDPGTTIIAESSTASVANGMKTRSRARLANTTNISATPSKAGTVTKTTTTKTLMISATKSTLTKSSVNKKKMPANASNLNTNSSTTNLNNGSNSSSMLNMTPSKKKVNLSGLNASASKPTIAAAGSSSTLYSQASSSQQNSNNMTPRRAIPRRACAAASPAIGSTTPAVAEARRKKLNEDRMEKLSHSVGKLKKAEENKKALLEGKVNVLKTEREKRLEKIRENKQAFESQKPTATAGQRVHRLFDRDAGAAEVLAAPNSTMTKAQARNAERRLKLFQLQEKDQQAKKPIPKIVEGPKTGGAGALKKMKDAIIKKVVGKPAATPAKAQVPRSLKGGAKNKKKEPEVDHHEPMEVDGQEIIAGSVIMSPIAKTSDYNGEVIHLNETITIPKNSQTAPTSSNPSQQQQQAPVVNSTVLQGASFIKQKDSTFAVPTGPAPVATPNKGQGGSSAMTNHLKAKLNETQNYEMTPPPREQTFDANYDISKYIDSDDEAEQEKYERGKGDKKVPKWAQGKTLVKEIVAQFGQPADVLNAQIQAIFAPVQLPVPLEDMGLTVRQRYQQRSSSVNWRDAEDIQNGAGKKN